MIITKKLYYGVSEDTPKELLYVKKIILRSYDDENKNKTFMEIMSNFKIYQFNYDKAEDSDYFMWQYVNDNGIRDWKHIDLCCYQSDMESVHKMWNLFKICETTNIDINAEIQFDDIRNLIKEIEKKVWRN